MLMDDPGAVEAVHLSYYRAGALCQSTVIARLSLSLLVLPQLASPWSCHCCLVPALWRYYWLAVPLYGRNLALGEAGTPARIRGGQLQGNNIGCHLSGDYLFQASDPGCRHTALCL